MYHKNRIWCSGHVHECTCVSVLFMYIFGCIDNFMHRLRCIGNFMHVLGCIGNFMHVLECIGNFMHVLGCIVKLMLFLPIQANACVTQNIFMSLLMSSPLDSRMDMRWSLASLSWVRSERFCSTCWWVCVHD